ncbi:MAG: ribonuclease HI [Lachnospiraceae bacterium]|nr:ribonuclease HI [Lachnospiraceae bacterium]
MANIKIYTDGACKGNPGPGGWACILSTVLTDGRVYEIKKSGGYRLTTNNRMEIASIIFALSSLNGTGHNVEVISDSKYVCDAFNQHWIDNWRKNGWKKASGKLPNEDMWRTLWNLVTMQNNVKFTWIKGHSGHPYNEECDRLAVYASRDKANWQIDTNYEAISI